MTYPGREAHYMPLRIVYSGVSKEDALDCLCVALQRLFGSGVTEEQILSFINEERKLKGQKPRYMYKGEVRT